MEDFVDLAKILAGIAVLVGFISGIFKNRKSISIFILKLIQRSEPKLTLTLDEDFNPTMPPEKLNNIIQDALFLVRGDRHLQLHCEIPELNKQRTRLKRLSKQNKLSPDEIKIRNTLQQFFKSKDKRLKYLENVITTLITEGAVIFSSVLYGDTDWSDMTKGVILRTANIGKPSEGTKIDIWKDKPSQISASINISENEMESILKKLNLVNPQDLATGFGGHLAGDLPRDILVSKAIPAITSTIIDEIEFRGADKDEMKQHFDPHFWNIGLG